MTGLIRGFRRINPLWLLALLWGVGMVAGVYRSWITRCYTDFDVYYDAGTRFYQVLRGQAADFTVRTDETSPFRYAPFLGWLFIPLTFLPRYGALAVWAFLQWCCYGCSLWLLRKHFKLSAGSCWIVFLGTLRFAVDNANIGQISALDLLLLTFAATSTSATFSGWSLAATSLIKIRPLAFAGIWILRKDWKRIRSLGMGLVVLILLSLSFGHEAFLYWTKNLFHTSLIHASSFGNQALWGVFSQNTNYGSLLHHTLAVCTLIGFYRLWLRHRKNFNLGWSLGIVWILAFGMLTWKNTFILLAFPLSYVLTLKSSSSTRLALGASLIFLLSSREVIGWLSVPIYDATMLYRTTAVLSLLLIPLALIGSKESASARKHR